VYAIDRATGKEAWAFAAGGRVDGSPAVDGGRVYVGTLARDGPNFFALDLKTGRKLHELELDSAVGGSVAVGPDCVLVGTDRGAVYCLRVR
jgi:outer membrane protein assembly factor BamB